MREIKKFIATTIREYLNEQQNIETNINDKFWKWFGNSKIVYNGKPILVHHGSRSEFDEFFGDTFFTDDYMNADGYAGGEYVYDVYISIKNPLIIDAKGRKWDDIETENDITSTQGIVGTVDRSKYDGVIINNVKDSWIDDVDYQDASTIYVTFKPNQIKSDENDGTWDIDDNNIYS